jgi:hypothetical protein
MLLITGGHGFEREPFLAMFEAMPDVEWTEAQQPEANHLWVRGEVADYDAVVLYDFWQEITEEQKEAFVRGLRDEGTGLVVLHHAIADYQHWPEYTRIIGARYFLKPDIGPDGRRWERSQYQHDVLLRVRVANPEHPVTRGLEDFEIHDETYKGYWVSPQVQPLLTTEHPLSERLIGWAHTYGRARVVYFQLGHDRHAYENPSYRRLVHQALLWVGGKR